MKKRKMKNRLLELIQERERTIGRRVKQRATIINWIRNDVSRFESRVVERLCEYFNCDVGDLLYFEWVEADEADMEETADFTTKRDDDKNQKGES
jgi:hypothetical protein